MTTIRELLARLRTASLDERDKGDRFERLIRAYLLGDPQWTAKFSQVWLWSEWPGRDGRPDTGIDLVCERRDGDGLAAVQCKFYAETATVAKGDIDSFLSASSTGEFSGRYVFDTADAWSKNAEETIERQQVPVSRIDIGYLDDARVDWDQFSWDTPEVVVPTGSNTLKDHQTAAPASTNIRSCTPPARRSGWFLWGSRGQFIARSRRASCRVLRRPRDATLGSKRRHRRRSVAPTSPRALSLGRVERPLLDVAVLGDRGRRSARRRNPGGRGLRDHRAAGRSRPRPAWRLPAGVT